MTHAVLPFQFQAVGLSIYGVMVPLIIPIIQ